MVGYYADEMEPARELLLHVRNEAVTTGDEHGVASVGFWLTELEVRAGNLRVARGYADEALAIMDVGQHDVNLAAMIYVRALVAAYEGEVKLTRRLVSRGLTMDERLGDRMFATQHRGVIGFLELSLDRPSEALDHLALVDENYLAMGAREPGAFPHRNDLLEALIGAGHIEGAERQLKELTTLGQRLDRPRLLCHALRAEAMLAAHRGDHEAAETLSRRG